LIILGIIGTLILTTSKAKYKNIQTLDLVNGTINYTPADIDLVAIYQKNDSGAYESVATVPASGYILSDTSYCNVNGEKDTSINITYQNGKVGIGNITKKVKCYLYFDKKVSASDTIIGDLNPTEKTSFTGIATSTDTGIFKAPDDYGISYYFRGVETSLNNLVEFAGFYWRIIRINGNGTVRMIYQGTANGGVTSANKTGKTTQINSATYQYNNTYNDNAYVGYMMGIPLNGVDGTANTTSTNSTSYSQAHSNIYDSNAKKTLDNWYKSTIENRSLSKYIDINTGFCNDREIASGHSKFTGGGYSNGNTLYKPGDRLIVTNASNYKSTLTPILRCSNKNRDLFTHNSANIGNKKLNYPVGMITMDEVIFAGGFVNASNSKYYLNTNEGYWTMSPYNLYANAAQIIKVSLDGAFLNDTVSSVNTLGLRPVINLKSDTKLTYNNESTKGSASDPFVVV